MKPGYSNLASAILLAVCCAPLAFPAAAEDKAPAMPYCRTAPLNAADSQKLIDIMRDNLKKMDAQLEQIRNGKDDQARDKALQEYRLTLGENLRLGHGVMGYPMHMGGMMGYGGMGTPAGPMGMGRGGMGPGMMGGGAYCDPEARIDRLEKRIDLMQKRLDQLKKAKPAAAK